MNHTEVLRHLVTRAVASCKDEDLLDLILKLLYQED